MERLAQRRLLNRNDKRLPGMPLRCVGNDEGRKRNKMLQKPRPKNAVEFILQQLDAQLVELELEYRADILVMNGDILLGADDVVRDVIESNRSSVGRTPQDRLAVMLTTSGGYIEVVQRIVETIRKHYKAVDFIIPNYAYSAGTVLALSGDDIHMDYYSRLGPIDPQVQIPGKAMVPALGYLHQYNRLVKKAEDKKISMAEIQLMISGFDQALLYKYEQARELSVSLLTEWIASYKLKNWTITETTKSTVDDAKRKRVAKKIADDLNDTERWHSHGHGISRTVLVRDLHLHIQDFGENEERSNRIKAYHRLLVDHMNNTGQQGVLHMVDQYVAFA